MQCFVRLSQRKALALMNKRSPEHPPPRTGLCYDSLRLYRTHRVPIRGQKKNPLEFEFEFKGQCHHGLPGKVALINLLHLVMRSCVNSHRFLGWMQCHRWPWVQVFHRFGLEGSGLFLKHGHRWDRCYNNWAGMNLKFVLLRTRRLRGERRSRRRIHIIDALGLTDKEESKRRVLFGRNMA